MALVNHKKLKLAYMHSVSLASVALQLHTIDPHLRQSYARWLLQALCNISHISPFAVISLSDEAYILLQKAIHELTIDAKPLAYIIGSTPFANLTITTPPPLLIPRHETEEWCMRLIALLNTTHWKNPLTILDIGTGTGCIALAIAYACNNVTVYAVDKNPDAIACAMANAQKNNITSVHFIESDLLSALDASLTFDLIVSNPPYISADEWRTLDASVRVWEDPQALIAQEDGYALLHAIAQQSLLRLKKESILRSYGIAQLWLEIGHLQGPNMHAYLDSIGYQHIQLHNDLFGNTRLITASPSL